MEKFSHYRIKEIMLKHEDEDCKDMELMPTPIIGQSPPKRYLKHPPNHQPNRFIITFEGPQPRGYCIYDNVNKTIIFIDKFGKRYGYFVDAQLV